MQALLSCGSAFGDLSIVVPSSMFDPFTVCSVEVACFLSWVVLLDGLCNLSALWGSNLSVRVLSLYLGAWRHATCAEIQRVLVHSGSGLG